MCPQVFRAIIVAIAVVSLAAAVPTPNDVVPEVQHFSYAGAVVDESLKGILKNARHDVCLMTDGLSLFRPSSWPLALAPKQNRSCLK